MPCELAPWPVVTFSLSLYTCVSLISLAAFSELLDEPVIVDKYTTEPLSYLSPVIEFDQAVPIVSTARQLAAID